MIKVIIAALFFVCLFFPPSIQAANKKIEVNLSAQRLYAYEDDKIVYDFQISSGKPWWPTPTGQFKAWGKFRYDRMIGGSRQLGTYYDLPNVPHTIYFYKGYAIHGAYWHSNFGTPMSHGCINLRIPEAAKLYSWHDNMNIPIRIYGTTPG